MTSTTRTTASSRKAIALAAIVLAVVIGVLTSRTVQAIAAPAGTTETTTSQGF